MEHIIEKIIKSAIPKGCIFDAHAIINYLIQYHKQDYSSSKGSEWTTAFYHSEISKTIATFEGRIIERKGESWSMHVNNQFSQNKCWIKL